jgi:hypothetical protein
MSESEPSSESMPVSPKLAGFRWSTAMIMLSAMVMIAGTFAPIFLFFKFIVDVQDEYTNAVKSCIGIKPSQCPRLGEYHWIDWTLDAEVQWGAMPHSTYVLRTEVFDIVQFLRIDNGVIVGPIEEEEANRIEEELRKRLNPSKPE